MKCVADAAAGRRKAFITGDSHTGALRRGLDRLAARGWDSHGVDVEVVGMGTGARFIAPFFRDEGTCARIVDPEYQQRVPALPLPGDERAEIAYGWSGLFHFAKVWRDRTWADFRPPFHEGPGAPVSAGLLRSVVLDWFAPQLRLMEILRGTGAQVFVVESPRPFRHHPALARLSPQAAISVDRFCRTLMLGEIERLGVGLVRIPPECLDAEGFMLAEWRSAREGDPHHANAAFGELMMRRVVGYLEGNPDG